MRIVKQTILILTVVAVAGGISGCNTVKGAGQDLKQGGQAIENAADRAAN
jgi:predicted small secreted protein